MSPDASEPIEALARAYLDFAVSEVGRNGRPRAPPTMSSYRRAVEGFVAAVKKAELHLEDLPPDFIEKQWLETQASVLTQPVQLRIRATAVQQFLKWLYVNNIPCAPMRALAVETPQPKPQPPKESLMSNAPLYDVTQLGDATREADPIPSTQSVQQFIVPPPPPRNATPAQTTQQSVPSKPAPRANPLANMLPTGQFKLRVRRERDGGEDPVFVGDYPSDRVQMAGAVEPFLTREVGPTMQKQGISGDVSFLVCAVNPANVEGDKTRFTVFVPNVQQAAVPVQQVINAQPTSREELQELLTTTRRAQEDLEERLAARFDGKQQSSQQAQERIVNNGNSEMDELKQMMRGLAQRVSDLAEQVSSRDSARYEPAPVAPPAPPQLNILEVIKAVDSMSQNRAPAAAAVAAPPAMGPMEVLKMMGEMKSVFQPQNIQVDVSPLEEELKEMRREQAAAKPKGLLEMAREFKELKELFQTVGGETSSPKPTFGQALGGMFLKFIENPTPIAEAAERVLNAARGGSQQSATTTEAPKLPPQVIEATKALLAAEEPSAVMLAAHEWLSVLATVPAFVKPVQRMSALLREGNVNGFGIVLQQVFKGLGAQVPPERCADIAQKLIAQLPQPEAAEEGDDEEESDEEAEGEEVAGGSPDMTIRVGGAEQEQVEEGDEDVEGEDGDDAGEGEAELAGAEEPDATPEEGAAGGGDEPEAVEAADITPEEVEAVTETKSERRKRRKAEKEAAAMEFPVEADAAVKPAVRG